MPDHGLGDDPRLLGIGPGVAAIVMRVRQIVEFEAHAGDGVKGARHDEQPVVVE